MKVLVPGRRGGRFGRFFNVAMFIANFAMLIAVGWLFVAHGYSLDSSMSGVEVMTVVLAALAVQLAALGIFIAVMAIWGYIRLSDEAISRAETSAQKHIEDIAPRLVAQVLAAQVGTSDEMGAAAAGEKGGSDAG